MHTRVRRVAIVGTRVRYGARRADEVACRESLVDTILSHGQRTSRNHARDYRIVRAQSPRVLAMVGPGREICGRGFRGRDAIWVSRSEGWVRVDVLDDLSRE